MTDTLPEPCDLLIEAGWVVPVEPHGVVLEGHAVAVRDGAILAVLPAADAAARYAPREHVRKPHSVLLPGLVNAHVHNPMTLLRGVADDLPLMVWLREHIWPIEGKVLGPAFVADGIELAIAEMVRGGTTCCNENYFFPDAAAATYARHGFRAVVGLPVIDFPTPWAASQDEYFAKALEVHDGIRADALVTSAFVPHAPYTVADSAFERIRVLADQLDIPVHLHVHETAQEVEDALARHGSREIARLDRLGLYNDRLIAVHMTQLTDAEIALTAERGVSVVHCPESNLKLASGFCPVEKLRRAGVNLALGTDGAASNNDLDMIGEMRTAALLAKAVAGDAAALDAASVLRMATLGGARAMGLDDRIGSIEPGKRADLVLVDMDPIEMQPLYHVVSQLVYASGRGQVSDVWIDGRRHLRDRACEGIDVGAVGARAREWAERIGAMRGGRTEAA
ncbi:TRZ/ATZ family hydrolase [Coralloluteibacterium stylophorae]|uniref:TRZ/ATZ family hydrolase n=1 Tax=Coralloluteibacterium stylophorae TaxID=1776034 RepID=A0A8J7VXT2_9GAMM|nr:TRZ/ATZ family hydrolase [Coralloluteibacterium stylophorae]MBS7455667.1 TRZ/ATZ family hydrolase [Coralloluteibacterium stylophorae]